MGYLENEHGKFQVEKTIHHPESIHIVVHQGHFIGIFILITIC